jgi:hypothetical protein
VVAKGSAIVLKKAAILTARKLVILAMCLPLLLLVMPKGHFVGTPEEVAASRIGVEGNTPAWHHSYAERFPGCHADLPEGTIPATVLMVTQDGKLHHWTFDHGWKVATVKGHLDVWVVGKCVR